MTEMVCLIKAGQQHVSRIERVRLRTLFLGEELFKQEACQEPVRKIVKPHDFPDMPAGALVVPGTELVSHEKMSAEILNDKDAYRVNAAS